MEIVGLTGGIASGKSTVAKMLRDDGVAVVDADQLAREAVEPGSEGLRAVVDTFGEGVLDKGALDRGKLGQIIFGDDDKRRALNAIIHPIVARLAAERSAALAAEGQHVMVYEVPLLFESGLDAAMSCTILVAVDESVQLARIMARDGFDEDGARARIRAQMPLHEKRARASYTIENDGELAATRAQLDEIWAEISARWRA